ncbi:MAG: hypothetical protein P8L84_01665 [Methylococcaceae bacterium]|nr:hypothetical protein [Methylococcaceae bacterium]
MYKIILLLHTLFMLSGCSSSEEKAKEAVLNSLKDPSSVVFGEIWDKTTKGSRCVIGDIYAKNSHDGFTETKLFFYNTISELVVFPEDDSEFMDSMISEEIYKNCEEYGIELETCICQYMAVQRWCSQCTEQSRTELRSLQNKRRTISQSDLGAHVNGSDKKHDADRRGGADPRQD